jgi:hypothetical protein
VRRDWCGVQAARLLWTFLNYQREGTFGCALSARKNMIKVKRRTKMAVKAKKKAVEIEVEVTAGQTADELIEQLASIKDQKEALATQTSELNKQEEYVEGLLISYLQGQGLQKASSARGTASIKEDRVPSIVDWKKALDYIIKRKEFQLLTKKVNSAGWREMVEAGQDVPGVERVEITKLLFRRKANGTSTEV